MAKMKTASLRAICPASSRLCRVSCPNTAGKRR
jgi:hypothetical protein